MDKPMCVSGRNFNLFNGMTNALTNKLLFMEQLSTCLGWNWL